MKVKELVEVLKTMTPDDEVYCLDITPDSINPRYVPVISVKKDLGVMTVRPPGPNVSMTPSRIWLSGNK